MAASVMRRKWPLFKENNVENHQNNKYILLNALFAWYRPTAVLLYSFIHQ